MATNRKRTVRHRAGYNAGIAIPENDLEFLMQGYLDFTGASHSFESEKAAQKFYRKHKKWIFLLQGMQIPGCNPGVFYFNFGSRPWCWYRFENDERLFFKFKMSAIRGDIDKEFNYLKRNSLLFDGEAAKFKEYRAALQKKAAAARLKSKDAHLIVDNTKSIDEPIRNEI